MGADEEMGDDHSTLHHFTDHIMGPWLNLNLKFLSLLPGGGIGPGTYRIQNGTQGYTYLLRHQAVKREIENIERYTMSFRFDFGDVVQTILPETESALYSMSRLPPDADRKSRVVHLLYEFSIDSFRSLVDVLTFSWMLPTADRDRPTDRVQIWPTWTDLLPNP